MREQTTVAKPQADRPFPAKPGREWSVLDTIESNRRPLSKTLFLVEMPISRKGREGLFSKASFVIIEGDVALDPEFRIYGVGGGNCPASHA